ncbi:uncharacterized protein STEHIDRAFT_156286 [Stereum hirsutum FP-91666 SS1]|uniref:uncharacterized protein n=1 Tax=Stereum hirsutum (strain FP-91666) TaxID=721885 RepID=UPI000440EE0E|nr:uncharacterized protein STEHIDRAFT_156286 [Stereum hirsutum FP-91666 SS1]EIM87305.1 hypothetical protein STEHIDRAFT_156286 [Stereum hirsutum FP-91666 SS1]
MPPKRPLSSIINERQQLSSEGTSSKKTRNSTKALQEIITDDAPLSPAPDSPAGSVDAPRSEHGNLSATVSGSGDSRSEDSNQRSEPSTTNSPAKDNSRAQNNVSGEGNSASGSREPERAAPLSNTSPNNEPPTHAGTSAAQRQSLSSDTLNPDGTEQDDPTFDPSTSASDPATLEEIITSYEVPEHFNETLQRRVRALLLYRNQGDSLFSLSYLPWTQVCWGSWENGTANRLCIRGQESTAITVWLIGHLNRLHMFEDDGSFKHKVSISVTLLTNHMLRSGFKVLTELSKPPEPVDTSFRRINASRWLTSRRPGQREIHVDAFHECYDATRRYQTKTLMPHKDVEDLKEGDLVLVEAQISRFSTSTDYRSRPQAKDKAKARNRGFVEWKAMFELSSVSLLRERPDIAEQPSRVISSVTHFTGSI